MLACVALLLWGATPSEAEAQLEQRFAADARAAALAVALFQKTGDVVLPLPAEEDFDGGYRGIIHLVPQLPLGEYRAHLERVCAALADYDAFFERLEQAGQGKPRFRWRGLELRFFRSVKRRTPAAFASGWVVSYNVNGTLNGSVRQVRDLMFHELFHSNDADHRDWSARTLQRQHRLIRLKCGGDSACLQPYAPDPLMVRGGTYYSFQPGNDEREYGADLALRYWREQREALAGRAVAKPFKCLTPENATAWAALVDEFFAGVDAVPACAAPR
ncbi:MAG: hypothetical protein IPJ65_21690 [Archangiaceae bacterium]|nr:hypothetical protein [Archangiaceae bacterium]